MKRFFHFSISKKINNVEYITPDNADMSPQLGLVFRPEDYVYSSAVDYAGDKGLLDVTLIK